MSNRIEESMRTRHRYGRHVVHLIVVACFFFTLPAKATDAVSVYRPIQFRWYDGSYGSWNSFQAYQAAVNQIFQTQFAACQAQAYSHGSGSCSTRVITGSDPFVGGTFEIYRNGQPYWNWLQLTAISWGLSNGVESSTTSYMSNGSSGDYAAFADPVCPAGMSMTSALISGPDPQARYYDVTCRDPAESACPTCTTGSVNNLANVPLIGNPVNPATFEKTQFETDYAVEEGRLAVTRQYRSGLQKWTEPFPQLLDFSPLRPSTFPTQVRTFIYKSGTTSVALDYALSSSNGAASEVDITRMDGTRLKLNEGPGGVFAAMNGSASATRQTVNGTPSWVVNAPGNTIEVYGQADGRLSQVAYADGYILDYSYPQAGVVAVTSRRSGRALSYSLSDINTLSQVTLPGGLALGYQGTGALYASVQYADATSASYAYDEPAFVGGSTQSSSGLLTGRFDELGVRLATYQYNTYGQAVSTELAGGVSKYQFASLTVTDPLGTVTNMWWATAPDGTYRRSMVHEAAGSGSVAANANYSYDSSGNLTSFSDFDGNVSCFVSDATRNLELVRIEGLGSVGCSSYTPAGAALPAGSRKITRQWHPERRYEIARAAPSRLTTWVYNGQPDPFNGGATASCAPVTALLPDGRPIAVLCKQVEQASTDADGHLGFTAALQPGVANRVQQWTYNQYGQVLTAKGARTDVNDTTNYAYYASTTANYTMGDLSSVTNAAQQTTQFPIYNKHGQVLRSIDANGVVTDNTYDLRQRLTSTTVGGLLTVYTYDLAGLLKQLTLPDTTTVTYTYDPAHRLTKVTDQAGNSVTYTLDNAGNRTQDQIKDPSGTLARTITRAFDALGRVQQMTGASQ